MKKNEIIGHEQIIEHISTAVRTGKVSHAYLFHGEKGSGKHFLSHYFAKLLQCEHRDKDQPCCACKSCLQAESGNHPDIVTITHEKASVGVDEIREQLNADIAIKPYSSPYKIYLIPDADKMTEQAQNALLKTIEEPPAYGVVMLLADNINRMLPTIRSRCIALPVKGVEAAKLRQYLIEEYQVDPDRAQMAADFSGGNIGRAERYALSEEFAEVKDSIIRFLRKMDETELHEMMETVKQMTQMKLQIRDCIELMMLWFRDILVLKATGDPNRLVYKDEYHVISSQAEDRDYASIEAALEAMDQTKRRLEANVNFETAVELMLLAMRDTNG